MSTMFWSAPARTELRFLLLTGALALSAYEGGVKLTSLSASSSGVFPLAAILLLPVVLRRWLSIFPVHENYSTVSGAVAVSEAAVASSVLRRYGPS